MVEKRGVKPYVKIKKDDASYYTFDPFTPSYDFYILPGFSFRPPMDSSGGVFTLPFTGGSNSATNTILSNISEGNEVEIYTGKSAAGDGMMRGVIEEIEIQETNKNFMKVTISGRDFGSDILQHTVVNGEWIQRKTSDGVTLDNTDDTTLLENIVEDIITNTNKYPNPADAITAESKGVVFDLANLQLAELRIPQFYANMEFVNDKLSQIDEIGFTNHFVNFDNELIMRPPLATNSGILLTDDVNDAVAATWDTTKLGYIAESTYTMTLDSHRKRIFGIGGDQRLEDSQQKQTTTTTTTKNDTNWLGMRFKPYYDNIESIAVYVDKVGTPSDLVLMFLNNDPNTDKPIVAQPIRLVTKDKNAITGTAGWHYFQINEDVNPNAYYWVVLQRTNDASNYYRWYRTSGSTSYHTSVSSDGSSWTNTTAGDGFAYRAVSTSPLQVTWPGTGLTSSDKHFHEEVIRHPDVTQVETMQYIIQGAFVVGGKSKHIINMKVYTPDTILQSNTAVRIRKQQSGYVVDDTFIIGDITYRFDTVNGYVYQDVTGVRFVTYP